MAVKIRLSRVGKKKAPVYRIIAIDERKKRNGEPLEILGAYNPVKGEVIQFHEERLNAWIQQGAVPTDAVKKIQKKFKKDAVVA